MNGKLTIIGALILIIGTCFGVYFYAENRYALSQELKKTQEELKQTNQRIDYKILTDQLRSVQDRIWKIQDRLEGNAPRDATTKEELRQLEQDKGEMKEKIKVMENK